MEKNWELLELVAFKFDTLWSALYGEVSNRVMREAISQFAEKHGLTLHFSDDGEDVSVYCSVDKGWKRAWPVAHEFYVFPEERDD